MSFEGRIASGSYLRAYMALLDPFLQRPNVTDIHVNRPGEIWIETISAPTERVDVPELDRLTLERLARQIAARSNLGINRESPLLAATLREGERVQVIAPPATRGDIAISIRKQAIREMTLDDCAEAGLFDTTQIGDEGDALAQDAALAEMLDRRDIHGFLKQAILQRKNIIISGGTATGKTTFLNALLQQVPEDERLIVIEDTPEVRIGHANAIGLIAGGATSIDALLQASLRMRPSRIILGELRGSEAYSFLRAINTGHPGSVTTLHADSPRGAVEQLALMVLQSGTTLSRADILSYVAATVDVIIQLSRINGRRVVSAVRYKAVDKPLF